MFSKILILADQKSKRFLHKELLSGIKLDSEFILVKSFEQALEVIRKEDLSLIVLDNEVDDPGKHRKRKEAILELKENSRNLPVIIIGYERKHALEALRDGADGFIPMQWLSD